MNLSELTDMQLDALREISGIGAGHAATELSEIVQRTVRLEVPTISVIDILEVANVFGGPEQIAGAVYARLLGEIDGGVLAMARPRDIRAFWRMLGAKPSDMRGMPAEQRAVLMTEIVGQLIDAYLRAVSDMTGLVVRAAEPDLAYDMAGALLEAAVAEIGMRADDAVLVRTALVDEPHTVEAAFFFVPDPDSLALILGRLGLA